jgi:transcriptional regulator with XRE-family HTH domain
MNLSKPKVACQLGGHLPGNCYWRFLEELKQARAAAGLSLADLARRCRIDEQTLAHLEEGLTKNPTLDLLWRYAAAVGHALVSAEASPAVAATSVNSPNPKPVK